MTEPTNPNPNVMDDTRPSEYDEGGLQAPPKILFYGVLFLFMGAIIGVLASVVVFRDVLQPAQQQRVMNMLPFMEAFLPPRPAPDDTVPTSSAPVDNDAALDLLNAPLSFEEPTDAPAVIPVEATEEATAVPPTVEATVEVAAVPTVEPTATATLAPTMTPTTVPPTVEPSPLPPSLTPAPTDNISATFAAADAELSLSPPTWPVNHLNTGFRWEEQTWNNCGPTTITIALSYYGWGQDHQYAASRLKPYREDKNVSPWELVRFANENTDYSALYRYGGDLDMLRELVSAGFPVIIERSHMFEGYDWIGHYQTVVGYDDTTREFIILDSFLGDGDDGLGIVETYDDVEAAWRQFNGVFVVPYRPGDENRVLQILGQERLSVENSATHAFNVAQEEARANPNDAFAWYNMGTSLVELGRYEEAATAYDRAISLGTLPWRMLWYQFGPFEAYYNVGRYDDVLLYVENNLSNNGRYVEETYYWQGRALAAQGNTNGARAAYQRALNYNRNFEAARQALQTIN